MNSADHNPGLDFLLELDGEIFHMDKGYWAKIEAKKVTPNDHIPHGVKYSLTLHNRYNTRIIGYDNALGIKTNMKKPNARITPWDHKHEGTRVEPYEFKIEANLLEDFWNDVNKIITNTRR